jgi:hypothetical protein
MEEKEIWEGSASDLLNDMEKIIEEKVTRMRSWPKAANALSGRLTRAATFLRAVGIEIVRSKSGNRSITITYKKGEKTAQTAQTAQDEEPHGSKADDPLDDPEFSDEATAQKTDHWTTADGSPERPPTWKDAPDVDLDDMGDMGDKNREFTGDDKNVFDWQEFEI